MNHGTYRCSKCSREVSSKCIYQRSIFPAGGDNGSQTAALLSHVLEADVKDEKLNHGFSRRRIEVTFLDHTDTRGTMTDEELIMKWIKWLARLQTEQPNALKYWVCDHDYVPLTECGFGCCKPVEHVPATDAV